jgi:hypothetical protein
LLLLRTRYPALLDDPALREIACLPGWLDLLDELCKTLALHLREHPEIEPLKVVRIKEKWGGLRFHYNGGDDLCRRTLDAAQNSSLTICEICGAAGLLGGLRYLTVRCSLHAELPPDEDPEGESGDTLSKSDQTRVRCYPHHCANWSN